MINLKQDIADVIASKGTKDAAIFKIMLQPYFQTLAECIHNLANTIRELNKHVNDNI